MNSQTAGQITKILNRWKQGDEEASDELFPIVYEELRSLASAYLSRERGNHTLQPTALVHESYLRLAKLVQLDTKDRSHFFAVAARTMRRILVDHARLQMAERRVGSHQKQPINEEANSLESSPFQGDPGQIVAIHSALKDLERSHPRAAKLVEFRFFGGLSEADAAKTLDVSRATASREWRFARLWLFDYLNEAGGESAGSASGG